MSRYRGIVVGMVITLAGAVSPALAQTAYWTDWQQGVAGTNGSATGVLNVDGTPVTVTYTGEAAFIQTGTGTNYYNPSAPYISADVPVAPPAAEMIALSQALPKTITFSESISNPLFAVVSLNGNGYQFDRDFEILSFGQGYWGNGTLTKSNPSAGIYQLNGTGEPHGVIRFLGNFDSVSWTSLTNEYWNGFTIGVQGLAVVDPDDDDTGNPEVPAPAALPAGLAMLGVLTGRRRRRCR